MYGNGVNRSTAKAIGKQIEKLLHDLGNPEPPLKLDHVRHLLTLDRHYYSSDDHSLFMRAFHKMTIAGKQLINRPGLIKDVISKRKLRALWEPDARPSVPERYRAGTEHINVPERGQRTSKIIRTLSSKQQKP
jgi:hypothetical protein